MSANAAPADGQTGSADSASPDQQPSTEATPDKGGLWASVNVSAIAGGVLGLLGLFAFLSFVAGARPDAATIGLVVAAGALLWCLRSLFQMARVLSQPDLTLEFDHEASLFAEGRRELREERRRLLRAIKELEFDHQIGKLSDADYREVRAQYELKVVDVMRRLEAEPSLHPSLQQELLERGLLDDGGSSYRTQAESPQGAGDSSEPAADASGEADHPAASEADASQPASEAKMPDDGEPEDGPSEHASAAEAKPEDDASSQADPQASPKAEAKLADEASSSADPPGAEADASSPADPPGAAADASSPADPPRAEPDDSSPRDSAEVKPATILCRVCETPNDDDAKFCKNCGSSLAIDKASSEAEESSQ